eukprot:GHVH01013707.1.p1 GENE.GHVH01013707.1~~GHVH01013707.1.p1  ORF type:complete len:1402 (-),score=229.73 GHVH01013707.1:2099-6304(-)
MAELSELWNRWVASESGAKLYLHLSIQTGLLSADAEKSCDNRIPPVSLGDAEGVADLYSLTHALNEHYRSIAFDHEWITNEGVMTAQVKALKDLAHCSVGRLSYLIERVNDRYAKKVVLEDIAFITVLNEVAAYWEFLRHSITMMDNAAIREGVILPLHAGPRLDQKRLGKLEKFLNSAKDTQSVESSDYAKASRAWLENTWIPTVLRLVTLAFCQFSDLWETDSDAVVVASMNVIERCLDYVRDLWSTKVLRKHTWSSCVTIQLVTRFRYSQAASHNEGLNLLSLLKIVEEYDDWYLRFNDCRVRLATLEEVWYNSHGSLVNRVALEDVLQSESTESLLKILDELRLISPDVLRAETKQAVETKQDELMRTRAIAIVKNYVRIRNDVTDEIDYVPLYPTEEIMFNSLFIPDASLAGPNALCLPRLDLQFLNTLDYLKRNFELHRVENAYILREAVIDVLHNKKAFKSRGIQTSYGPAGVVSVSGGITFGGKHKNAADILSLSIMTVLPSKTGSKIPSKIRAEVVIGLEGVPQGARESWNTLGKNSQILLLAVRPDSHEPVDINPKDLQATPELIPETYGLVSVRGAEVESILDEEGNEIIDPSRAALEGRQWNAPMGSLRTFRVLLDPAQFAIDDTGSRGVEDLYGMFNVAMRVEPAFSNFKAVLETNRNLISEYRRSKMSLSPFLENTILGFGAPGAAHCSEIEKSFPSDLSLHNLPTINFLDTFLSDVHVKEAFPNHTVTIANPQSLELGEVRCAAVDWVLSFESDNSIVAKPELVETKLVVPGHPCSDTSSLLRRNKIRFTPRQVEAILHGVQPGLNLVVGPPGTGKTDTAVQCIRILRRNKSHERILVVAASNQALNDLFLKLRSLDIDDSVMLRLGMGEKELRESIGRYNDISEENTSADFSKWGRVNHVLQRRLELLEFVGRCSTAMGLGRKYDDSCGSAASFQWVRYQPAIEAYRAYLARDGAHDMADAEDEDDEQVQQIQNVLEMVIDSSEAIVGGGPRSFTKDEVDVFCTLMQRLFDELKSFQPFEVLPGLHHRTQYLLTQQSKVIAMTCTHAAIQRDSLIKQGFRFDTLLMEEASQIREMESFVPMMTQSDAVSLSGAHSLKRLILIGDHHQLPPVVQNRTLRVSCNFDQSLFSRLIRSGFPATQLDKQGRSRPEIADLYRWRYHGLGDLPKVMVGEYLLGNSGMLYTRQFVNVPDGAEVQPTPHYYQNPREAEWLVACYMYLRLSGYPQSSIAVLTTYKGQKELLKEIIKQRCCWSPGASELFGYPGQLATVDQYQGQQADVVLISLVRTSHPGHLSDVRRVVVTSSRARLGLYLFGRFENFSSAPQLKKIFNLFPEEKRLMLVKDEAYGTCVRKSDDVVADENQLSVVEMKQFQELIQEKAAALLEAL